MDGLQDETRLEEEGAQQASQAQLSAAAGRDAGAQARADYEAVLAERDARIAEFEGEIAEAAKTAEGAERLRAEMDELRRRSDEEHVGFELQLAWSRNVKAARALLSDHDDDIEKPKGAEHWLFSAPAAPLAPAGAGGCRARAPPGPMSPRR